MREIVCKGTVALVDDPETALSWWRVTAPWTRLLQHRVPARWARLADATVKLHPADVVVFPRLFPLGVPEGRAMMQQTIDAIRAHSAAIIWDGDDDLISDEYVRHHLLTDWGDGKDEAAMRRQCEDTIWAINQCDGVTAASEPLAALIRQHTDRPVHVVPNAIDVRWYRSRLAARSLWHGQLTIGWAGGRRPPGDFAAMAEAWGRVARRRSDVRFVVAGDPMARRAAARHVPSGQVEHIEWAHVQDAPMATQLDIGCCAVEDEPFNRRKTPIKCWEYALGGAAVVATPALYAQDVADGFTGRLAVTADDWEDALMDLLEHPERRDEYQQALSARVERLHGLDNNLHRWTEAWNAIAASRRQEREVAA